VATTLRVGTADGEMAIYDAEPEGPARAAVVVIQEAFGVNEHIEDVTRRFAAAGYRAVSPHLFHRTGDPVLDYGNFEKVRPQMEALTEAGLLSDLEATFGHLATAGFGPSRVGVVGFCMGGDRVVPCRGPSWARRGGHLLRRRRSRGALRHAVLGRDGSQS
jgi:carboxymethylenebutenolidase